MTKEEIQNLVKNLEPYFHGYKAKENSLTNDIGLELLFYCSWNGKTSVLGVGAKCSHSIGCSFTKSLDKIAKDIRKRLLPEYRDDFLSYRKEKIEHENKEKQKALLLDALANACDGSIDQKLDRYSSSRVCVENQNLSIFEPRYSTYTDYEISIELGFAECLKVITFLKEENLIQNKQSH